MEDTPCTYRISVKALIKDDMGRILLLRETDGNWELPGGGLEHGEDPRTGLAREIAEETGFAVDWVNEQPAAFWTIHKDVGHSALKWFAFVAYEAEVSGEFIPGLSEEGDEARYFTPEEARQLTLHDNTRPYFGNPAA
jgi:8-oxo-dGTP diphosphatase